ncbi:hypothetical protein [Pseudomonas sp. PNPG3]|uniref:hypothetical protein n=1 Tax=Pseudomonas sp. PNPG3 TaxID=2919497 RepID=UPI001FFD8077|nr:hypothetical protein [Pseudomonas sp. PNPG3]MCK2120809.1 hypothetical protein [Pseudomonas sp. PNPG3]
MENAALRGDIEHYKEVIEQLRTENAALGGAAAVSAFSTLATRLAVKDSTYFLQAAIDVQAERGKQYDAPGGERSMGRTVQAFNAITGRDLTEAEGWLLLQVLKDVRQWQNPDKFHEDSALDGVAYSSLKAEALAAGGRP